MFRRKKFSPDWTEKAPSSGTMRSIVKYGNPNAFKHPSHGWVTMMMEEFGMSRGDFSRKIEEGNQKVELAKPVGLDARHIDRFRDIVGSDNVACDPY
ncbi:MAG TPA: FAD-binding oxidoreductase, partial [Deltaproteobacteria bacterium]|nr:FAD-binding oxidoreductase [Deltaproteobacteria bacterium]